MYIFVFFVLLYLSWQDIKEHMIYDCVPIGTTIIVLFWQYYRNEFLNACGSAILGFSFFYLIHFLYKYFKKEDGFGLGDVYVIMMLGACTQVLNLYFILLWSFSLALCFIWISKLYKIHRQAIPLVPFLSLGALIQAIINYF